jgi:CRP/FNR family transcriptional regulator, cyclic AMP receptor protein
MILSRPTAASRSFFGILTRDQCLDLFGRGRVRRWERGATLFTEGATDGSVMVVLSGLVRTRSAEPGDYLLGPGALLGHLSVLAGRAHSATASAVRPARTLALSRHAFEAFLVKYPDVSLELLRRQYRHLAATGSIPG